MARRLELVSVVLSFAFWLAPAHAQFIPPAWDSILAPEDRFQLVLADAAVLDRETGLVWERDATTGPDFDWFAAARSCYNKGTGGRKGWRPATVEELTSLLIPTEDGFTRPGAPFGIVYTSTWSGSTVAGDNSQAWVIHFSDGDVNAQNKSNCCGFGVWCVRGRLGHDGK
jgi:hypothetical protein